VSHPICRRKAAVKRPDIEPPTIMARRFRVFACSALGMFSVLTPSMSDTLFQGQLSQATQP
jgi:hypothetical protein